MKTGDLEIYEWDLEGEKIIREPKSQAWRIVLNHSFRQNGKVKKMQIYMRTLSWWDFVDGYLGLCEPDKGTTFKVYLPLAGESSVDEKKFESQQRH